MPEHPELSSPETEADPQFWFEDEQLFQDLEERLGDYRPDASSLSMFEAFLLRETLQNCSQLQQQREEIDYWARTMKEQRLDLAQVRKQLAELAVLVDRLQCQLPGDY